MPEDAAAALPKLPRRGGWLEPVRLDRETFRSTLSRFASGVTVVTSALGGDIGGMTVSAFCSVALEPHLVLVSLAVDKETTKLVAESAMLAVNILSAGQERLSERFAFVDHGERFDGVDWSRGVTGLPHLAGALAVLECRVTASLPAGDHVIYVGEVHAAWIADGEPLVYSQGAYRPLKD